MLHAPHGIGGTLAGSRGVRLEFLGKMLLF
jgi:hypothetical protein